MNCPKCGDEAHSQQIDQCDCGWAQTFPLPPMLPTTVEEKIKSLAWGDSMTFEGRGVLEKELRELVALVQAAAKP